MNIIGTIESNVMGRHSGEYVLCLRGPVPKDVPQYMLTSLDPLRPPREGYCRLVRAGETITVEAVGQWYATNGDILIAAKLVPAPPPMMAVVDE